MNIVICDDEKNITSLIEKYIKQGNTYKGQSGLIDIYQVNSGLEFELLMNKITIDILFLDIVLNQEDGIDIGASLQMIQKQTKVVIITGHPNMTERIFDIKPYSLLLKPINKDKLENIFSNAVHEIINEKNSFIVIRTKEGIRNIAVDDVYFFESQGRYVLIHMKDGEIINAMLSISEAEEFKLHEFVRVHRGYLLNIKAIEKITKSEAVLWDGSIVYISRNKVKMVNDMFIESVKRIIS